MQKWIFLVRMLLVGLLFLFPVLTYANAIFNIIPNTNSITFFTSNTVTYTATNNTQHAIIGNITIDPGYQNANFPIGISLQENNCAGLTLASGASCTFKVLLTNYTQQSSFITLMPRVCGYLGAVCSVPVLANRVQVTSVPVPVSDTSINSFSLDGIAGIITGNTISVTVPFGNDVTALIATFDTADGNTVTVNGVTQNSSITPNNFTTPVTYLVTGSDGRTSQYVVTVGFVPQTGQLTPLSVPTVPAGTGPGDIIMSPNGNYLYGNNVNTGGSPGEVGQYSINTTTGELSRLSPYSVATGVTPFTITLTPDGRFAYVSNTVSNSISEYTVDPVDGQLTPFTPASIPVGGVPFGIAVNANSTFAYVVMNNLNQVYQFSIDSVTGALTQLPLLTVATGLTPRRIALSANGAYAYVTNSGDNTISQYSVDAITGQLSPLGTPTVATGATPFYLALSPNGKFAYVNNSAGSSISQYSINQTNGQLSPLTPATVPAGTNPRRIVLTPNGMFLYATNNVSNTISQYSVDLNLGTLTALSPATVASSRPLGMAVSVNGGFVYVSNNTANTISQFKVN